MKIKLGKLVIGTYEGCQGDRIFYINLMNSFGGSFVYAEHSLLKVIWKWIRP